jgi:hypothetical protein
MGADSKWFPDTGKDQLLSSPQIGIMVDLLREMAIGLRVWGSEEAGGEARLAPVVPLTDIMMDLREKTVLESKTCGLKDLSRPRERSAPTPYWSPPIDIMMGLRKKTGIGLRSGETKRARDEARPAPIDPPQ